MNFKIVGSIIIGAFGVSAMFYAFLTNSSPYVTIQEAQKMNGSHLHLAGDLIEESLAHNLKKGTFSFKIRDQDQSIAKVIYHGPPPANIYSVNRVVAIGGFKGKEFHSHKLLIKCPSKYESNSTSGQELAKK